MPDLVRLGVNIDHVATLRQARKGKEPDPVTAAALAEMAGADGISVHLRGDRRHIQERDLQMLREIVRTRLNLVMAANPSKWIDKNLIYPLGVVRRHQGVGAKRTAQ